MTEKEQTVARAKRKRDHSLDNAKAAFKSFSLKRKTGETARTYVDPQGSIAEQQLSSFNRQLPNLAPTGPGLRLVASDAHPLAMDSDGNIDLSLLIASLEKAKNGTQFYTAATSIADKMSIQSRIDAFFSQLKGEPNDNAE